MSKRNTARIVVGIFLLATATSESSLASAPKVEQEAPHTSADATHVLIPASQGRVDVESRQLGRANSALSARPVNDPGAGDDGILARLDPRRNEIMRVVGALAAVIGLLLVVRTVVRRAGMMVGGTERPSGVMEILARYPVGRGQQLILLKLARRIVLLHQSGTSMAALSEMTDRDEVAATLSRLEAGSSARGAAKFRTMFNEFLSERAHGVKGIDEAKSVLGWPEAEVVDLTRGRKRGLDMSLARDGRGGR